MSETFLALFESTNLPKEICKKICRMVLRMRARKFQVDNFTVLYSHRIQLYRHVPNRDTIHPECRIEVPSSRGRSWYFYSLNKYTNDMYSSSQQLDAYMNQLKITNQENIEIERALKRLGPNVNHMILHVTNANGIVTINYA